jgi:hypothetical protein
MWRNLMAADERTVWQKAADGGAGVIKVVLRPGRWFDFRFWQFSEMQAHTENVCS